MKTQLSETVFLFTDNNRQRPMRTSNRIIVPTIVTSDPVGESLSYVNGDNTLPILVVFSAELLMGMHHNNLVTVSNTKSLKFHF